IISRTVILHIIQPDGRPCPREQRDDHDRTSILPVASVLAYPLEQLLRILGNLGAIPKCGHVALVLDCCYVDICVIFSSSGSLKMRLISQFSRASGARFSETDDSP